MLENVFVKTAARICEVRRMIKFCKDKWNENRDRLEKALRSDTSLKDCDYQHLLAIVVKNILNQGIEQWNAEGITVADNGSYSGTLMFLIPEDTYEPSEYEYLLTYVNYGSCSGCDALQGAQCCITDETPDDRDIERFMMLCKDLVTNMIRPYNNGWRHNDKYDPVVEEYDEA